MIQIEEKMITRIFYNRYVFLIKNIFSKYEYFGIVDTINKYKKLHISIFVQINLVLRTNNAIS